MAEKPKKGAPKGNHNAIKHGFYSMAFKKAQQFELDLASGMEGVSEEIALIRLKIKEAVSGGDMRNLMPLVHSALALEKLIRTHQKFFSSEGNRLEKAFENVVMHTILPLTKGGADQFLKWHYQKSAPPGTVLVTGDEEEEVIDTTLSRTQEQLRKQIALQDIADLTYNNDQSSEAK